MEDDFESLFLAEYPRVLSIAQRILRNRAEAEQVAEEVMVASYRQGLALLKDSPVHVHRKAVEAARHRAQDRQNGEKASLGTAEPARVREALARMPAAGAAVLALRSSRLTYAETAAVLEIKIEQVGPLLRRAELLLLEEVGA